uniref:Uncharacterized protein n=1 Tax=Plectus sambesii TaxID=2011161 RepID=A0A914VKF5_9BILA
MRSRRFSYTAPSRLSRCLARLTNESERSWRPDVWRWATAQTQNNKPSGKVSVCLAGDEGDRTTARLCVLNIRTANSRDGVTAESIKRERERIVPRRVVAAIGHAPFDVRSRRLAAAIDRQLLRAPRSFAYPWQSDARRVGRPKRAPIRYR